jgi:hypothetical protein
MRKQMIKNSTQLSVKTLHLWQHSFIKALVCIIAMIYSTLLYAQLAPVNPPPGGFAIDGGLKANTPTQPTTAQPWLAPNQGDWFPGTGGTGGSVFTVTNGVITAVDPSRSGRATDVFNSNDGVFTNGSKFNDYISALNWFTNSAPDKNDINNALYHVSQNPANNDQWVFVSGDRLSTNGTSYIDFELLQGTVTKNGTTSGGFTGAPLFPNDPNKSGGGRTLNDMIISMEYTNGGTKPNVYIYQWKKSGNTWSYQQVPVTQSLLDNAFAETNRTGAESDVPYPVFGPNNFTYQQYAFVEAAVNITYLLNLSGASCSGLNVQTLWVKTKASASSTAALKDFMDPIPVNFTFGSTQITQIGPFCVSNTTPQQLSANLSGTFSGPGVSNNQFTPSVAGVGHHEITFASTDGSCTASTFIDVVALPVVYTLSGNSICASAPNTGTITLSNSQTGVSYQLKKTSDNTAVQAAQNGTGAALTWTSLPAGVSYYVTATGAAPTSCTSNTTGASISETPNPTKPTADYKGPSCTETTFSVEIASPSAGTYILRQMTGGVSPITRVYPDNAVNGKIVFTGLTIGKGYSVTLTAGGCTSLPDECGTFNGVYQTVARQGSVREQEIVLNSEPKTNVTAAPNPFNDRIRFTLKSAVSGQGSLELYNMLGQRVKTVFQGQVNANQVQTIEYAVPGAQRSNLIYLFRVGDSQTTGKLIGLKK